MSDENSTLAETLAASDAMQAEKPKRKMSTIDFPYYDLDNVIEIARAIHGHVGHQTAETADVAGWLGQTITSGTFRLRMSAFRMFGLMKGDRGTVRLTEIGIKIVDPTTQREGRVEAFLSVELFKAIYDKFRGKMLPSQAGIESEMVALGVTDAQKDRARQTFDRSARQAGFFEHGADRLVAPSFIMAATEDGEEPAGKEDGSTKEAVKDAAPPQLAAHPLIDGLFKTLPPAGKPWAIKDRAKWLQAAAFNFSLIYEGDGEVRVSVISDAEPSTSG